jgi:hypothetical protein
MPYSSDRSSLIASLHLNSIPIQSLKFCTFAAIDCGTLEQPVGGSVTPLSSTLSSVATYNCTSGYILSGNRTRQCQPDGTWSGEMPQCIRKIHQIYLTSF